MNKMFSKSYIILPFELSLDYIILNYCLLVTIVKKNFIWWGWRVEAFKGGGLIFIIKF